MKKIIVVVIIALGFVFYFGAKKQEQAPETVPPSSVTKEDERSSPLDAVTLTISPAVALQGEPVLVTIEGPINSAALSWLTFDGQALEVFQEGGKFSAIVGIALNKKQGTYPVALTLADGRTIEKTLEVKERVAPTTEFDIPQHMGGNTQAGEQELTQNLTSDTATLNTITSVVSPEKLWEGKFRYPRDEPIVITDTYGYSRQTGSLNISHNGTDFRAAIGTPIYAMNSGKVMFNKSFRNYGNTVIIDHGLGLMTMYMHLSEIHVELDQKVEKGTLIAKSGNSGYSLAPHLHLSVRIGGFSIDPEKFLELMGPK